MPKIVSGRFKGHRLKAYNLSSLRPTLSRVKETIFNKLSSVEGYRVVDLFAGCGNLGFEAISRGAEHCIFVDKSRRAIRIISENAEALGIADMVELRCMDVMRFLETNFKADLILADPPYNYDKFDSLMKALASLHNQCKIVLECGKDTEIPIPEGLELTDKARIGDTIVYFFEL
ncbi:MAG: 16S rRNA (guanine(966)-N(2))-methyltransferase RsmD [Candidatus Neomarinimicrobiota bacterium]|nr:MAG: 16S rRNA (guanine(966)-N(2))-methyltransferase RsmD [Candidatus Neomarinimicrobiota bacterium]HDN59925.1 16S rRNA (guanine(966)-N(2))-methyltransferase RsmD [Candidatus Neomarinimicrobiota bacterium]